MAIFHFEITPIKRSTGQQATGAAAYRAGERIRDDRTDTVHNHSRRTDVRHTEIFLPSQFNGSSMEWARDRASLWNRAEAAEKRRDARVAREYQVALPPELTPEQRLALARSFSRELSDRYGVAVDLAVHDPKPGGNPHNFHAHLLTTTREITPTGLGAKAGLDMGTVTRTRQGLPDHSEEYSALRERWATLTNTALREANVEARVDHRSLAAQGIERKPLVHVPMEFYQLEKRGMPSEVAARLREDYRARVSARLERSDAQAGAEHLAAERTQAAPSREHAAPERGHTALEREQRAPQHGQVEPRRDPAPSQRDPPTAQRDQEPIAPTNMKEIRRRAVQAWLRMRSKEAESTLDKGAGNEATATRGLEDDRSR
jgi:ATP-dependent exoDNAse (exonuclease V) alpha subunit